MIRKSAFIVSVLGAALAVPALAGCQASFKAGGGAENAEEPPPPPPPPAPAEPAPEPAEEAPAPKTSSVTVKGDSISLPGNIVFDTGKATLKQGSGSEEVLEQLKLFLQENPRVSQLRVEGHTDNVGKPEDNIELSGQRALTIKRWLVDHGIKAERVIAVGFGESKPIADNSTDAGKAQNRRTEFKIAMLNGKKYLGMDPTAGGKVFKLEGGK